MIINFMDFIEYWITLFFHFGGQSLLRDLAAEDSARKGILCVYNCTGRRKLHHLQERPMLMQEWVIDPQVF